MLKQLSIAFLGLSSSLFANHVANLSIGPTWPKVNMNMAQKKDALTAANFSGSWGRVFDKRIILGAKADLTWEVEKYQGTFSRVDTISKTPLATDTVYTSNDNIYRKKRIFMVPLCGWIAIDPIPQYRFHPVLNAQFGYNSLFWSESNYNDGSGVSKEDKSKYYNGFFTKFGLDGMFDLGKQASIFGGFEYQIAPMYYREGTSRTLTSFNAASLRFGVSFLY